MLFVSCTVGYCTLPTVQVKVTPSDLEIFAGQQIAATVEVTNIGAVPLELPRPDRTGFSALLNIDDPHLRFSAGVGIVSVMGESPTVSVKPGESVSTKFYLSGDVRSSPFTFKMGFKPTTNSAPVWSNLVTVQFKKDQSFPVRVWTTLKENTIDISNVQRPQNAIAHIRIKNTGNSPQDIDQRTTDYVSS